MWSVVVVAAGVLVIAAAMAGAVLAWYLRRARRPAVERAPYEPSSVDPRGRWRISRIDAAALEPALCWLDTDSDDGGGDSWCSPTRPPREFEH